MLSLFRRDPGIKTYGRGYAWALVAFFTTASVLLNGAHAVLGMTEASPWARIWAVLTAILFPLAVLAETHFLVNLIREWDMRARWIAALRLVCIAAVLVVAYIAFVRSFYALGDMAALMGIPAEDWWMLPASIDAMIILATLGVVIAEGQMALDREEADAATVSEQRSVDRPVAPYEPVEQAVEVVDRPDERVSEQVDEQVDEQRSTDRATAPYEMDDRSVEQRSTGSDQAGRVDEHPVDRADEILSDLPVRPDEQMSEQWSTGAVDRPDELDDVVSDRPDELDDVVSEQPVEQPVDPSDRPDERGSTGQDEDSAEAVEWLSEAERVRSATGITADPADLATVLRMDDAGASRREIAEAVGRPKSTVSGWIAKASSVGDDRPALTAVR